MIYTLNKKLAKAYLICLLAIVVLANTIGFAATSPHYNFIYTDDSSTMTYPNGGITQNIYATLFDDIKQPTSIVNTDPETRLTGTTTITYDQYAEPSVVTDPNGNVTAYTYGGTQSAVTVSGVSYGGFGLLLNKKTAKGTALELDATYTWNKQSRLPTSITYSNGLTQNFSYGLANTLTAMTLISHLASKEWNYTYGTHNALVTTHAPWFTGNGKTSLTYDGHGHVSTVTNPLGQVSDFTQYNNSGKLLGLTDINGTKISFTYNTDGRLLTNTIAGKTSTLTYDGNGKLASITDSDGVSTDYNINYWDHLTQISDALGNTDNFTLNAQGKPTSETVVDKTTGKTVFTQSQTYDGFGRLKTAINANYNTITYAYNKVGDVSSITDAKGNTDTLGYNAQDLFNSDQNALSHTISYGHDPMGNITSVTDFNSHVTHYTYNPFGDITQIQSPVTGSTSYTYNSTTGLLDSKTDANANVVNYGYDAIGRLVTRTVGTQSVTNTYDQGLYGKGRLSAVSLNDTDHTANEFTYNAQGSITEYIYHILGQTYQIEYAYTPAQRIQSITYPNGKVITQTYDKNGNINGVKLGDTTLASNIHYLPFGPLNSMTLGNGANLIRTYNQNYQLTHQTVTNTDDDQYVYDPNGNITTFTDNKNSTHSKAYTYDAINRLKSVTEILDTSYDYDNNDNRINKKQSSISKETYQHKPNSDELASTTSNGKVSSVQHDANGNITKLGDLTFTYNGFNQLSQVMQAGKQIASYTYDGLGQRVAEINAGQNTKFIYGQSNRLLEFISPTETLDFIYLNDEPLAMLKGSDIYYFINDSNATPKYLTDQNNTTQWQADVQPFAIKTLTQNVIQPLRFPGQVNDSTTGLIYNQSRDYIPGLGRYLQPDSSGLAGSYNNLYSYTGQNPVNFIDPTGLFGAGPPIDNATKRAMSKLSKSWLLADALLIAGSFDGVDEIAIADAADKLIDEFINEPIDDAAKEGVECTKKYGFTPKGKPYTKHYGIETGPVRNLPGSVLDNTIDSVKGIPGKDGKTIYYDPENNVTVVTGNNESIVSARKGPPRKGQF